MIESWVGGMRRSIERLNIDMEFEITDSAMDAIRSKGGTAAIDFITPVN